jgi:hypothetical protein
VTELALIMIGAGLFIGTACGRLIGHGIAWDDLADIIVGVLGIAAWLGVVFYVL